MPYTHLDYQTLPELGLKKIFHCVDMYLFDAYGMFQLSPRPGTTEEGGISALLWCCCALSMASRRRSGPVEVSREIKRSDLSASSDVSFHGGQRARGSGWIRATQQISYITSFAIHQFINWRITSPRVRVPLAMLSRQLLNGDSSDILQNIAKIDALAQWDDRWPILSESIDDQGKFQFKLVAAGLYGAVKQLAKDMATAAKFGAKGDPSV